MYIERLEKAIESTQSITCLGLDPFLNMYPPSFLETYSGKSDVELTRLYMEGILDVAQGQVPVIKPQSAFFEAMGIEGVQLYDDLIDKAKSMGFIVIADIKRGDIGTTAEAYAKAFLPKADSVTVNPYMGSDSVLPFVDQARTTNGGLYVLVRTSNPSSIDLQDVKSESGRTLFEHCAEKVHEWGKNDLHNDLSFVGAVVGATWPEQGKLLRTLMPHTPFLIPGYGAQGGGKEGVTACARPDGRGIIVNSSRGLLYAWKKSDHEDWKKATDEAIKTMNADLESVWK